MAAGVQVLHSRPDEVATIDAYSPANERINNEYAVLVANCVFRTVHLSTMAFHFGAPNDNCKKL